MRAEDSIVARSGTRYDSPVMRNRLSPLHAALAVLCSVAGSAFAAPKPPPPKPPHNNAALLLRAHSKAAAHQHLLQTEAASSHQHLLENALRSQQHHLLLNLSAARSHQLLLQNERQAHAALLVQATKPEPYGAAVARRSKYSSPAGGRFPVSDPVTYIRPDPIPDRAMP